MSEILTESFCERCGTRYTFESAQPRGARLKGIRVMSRGLRNFVMSDDTSMDEAMAAARNETDREQTSQQLDAFHKTFNFCMSCRQYTCANCWNDLDGRCLSCAPMTHEVAADPFPAVATGGATALSDAEAFGLTPRNGYDEPAPLEPMAWPTSDLMREVDEQAAAVDAPVVEQVELAPEPTESAPKVTASAGSEAAETPEAAFEEAEQGFDDVEPLDLSARLAAFAGATHETPPIDAVAVPVEAVETPVESIDAPVAPEILAAAESVEPEAVPVAEVAAPAIDAVQPVAAEESVAPPDDQAAAAAANTSDLLRRFRPGQSIDDELEAYERAQAAETPAEPVVEPEPVVAAEPEPEPVVVEPESEPVVAAEPEPEPVVLEPVVAAAAVVAAEPEPEPEPVVVAEPEPVVAAEPNPEPEPVAAEPRHDLVPQPTWQIVAPEGPVEDQVAATAETQRPAQPEWPASASDSPGLPFLGRPAAATGGIEALWAESARAVADPAPAVGPKVAGGVQPCVSCGLSLSANARFCRRCGTRQG